MTRLSPTKSTVAPNCRFISAGPVHCALAPIANHQFGDNPGAGNGAQAQRAAPAYSKTAPLAVRKRAAGLPSDAMRGTSP